MVLQDHIMLCFCSWLDPVSARFWLWIHISFMSYRVTQVIHYVSTQLLYIDLTISCSGTEFYLTLILNLLCIVP
jgi:hypothetical protein